MEKKISYKIVPELNLVIKKYSGTIFLKDIISSKNEEISSDDFKPELNYIIDYRTANMQLDKSDIFDYINFAKGNRRVMHERRTALLVDQPLQVAYSQIYKELSKDLPMQTEVFSTLEASLTWVRLNENQQEKVESMLQDLKNK